MENLEESYVVSELHGQLLAILIFLNMHLFSQVTDFLLFLGKLMITAGMCALSFFVFAKELQYEDYVQVQVPLLNYTVVPVLIIGFGTYYIATVFFGVYAMAVDTLFLCFCKFYFYLQGMF